ncbi:MAG TPA: acyl-CoA dehydrogenase family protein [Thermoanaerobaculia bacterium]|nr:acyl-CoA dehydrogenase family protein [Thermoanaerobaculia bacterium]
MSEPSLSHAGSFYQPPPELPNQYLDDTLLRSLLRRLLPEEVLRQAEPQLRHLGERAVGEVQRMGDDAEANPPRHVPFDPWGRRIDRVETSPGWQGLRRVAAEEGLVALAYERPWGASSRVVQHALLYLFNPAAATYLCPLAMTDGAARLLEVVAERELRDRLLPRLTSRDPDRFWTSGQWMTERGGGSDVSASETLAVPVGDGSFRLYGSKWFTSAIDSEIAFTLARPVEAAAGSAGLSLFLLQLRDEAGQLQGIRVERLKDKLGTRALPTAELTLEGTPALLVGGQGAGVRKIAVLMNVTRVYNANGAVGGMRRALALARDYASRRHAFGRPLARHPLHDETLAEMEAEVAAGLLLLFWAASLQGREETDAASEEERRCLRLLTPLLKLYTGKQAVAVASEALECFGGAGYVEDTGLPRLLRDAQVLTIWEGTTNVLALDALRAIAREQALPPFLAAVAGSLPAADAASAACVREALERLAAHAAAAPAMPRDELERSARRFAMALGRTAAGALLLEQAAWSRRAGDPAADRWEGAARRWLARDLAPLPQGRAAVTPHP